MSGHIDLCQRFQNENLLSYLSGAKRLVPKMRDLTFYNWAIGKLLEIEKVVGLTGFVNIYVFIASFSPTQGERNQMVNVKFARPVNAVPMSNRHKSEAQQTRPFA